MTEKRVKVRGLGSLAGGAAGGISPGEVKEIPVSLAENEDGTGWVQTGMAKYVDGDYETAEDPGDVETTEAGADREWELKTSPEEYIERYGDQDDVSDTVAERLQLAKQILNN